MVGRSGKVSGECSLALAHVYVRVAGGAGDVVVDNALDVHVVVGPGLVCMVVLSITLGKYCVWREDGSSEGKHDGALDGCVGGAVVHLLVVGIE